MFKNRVIKEKKNKKALLSFSATKRKRARLVKIVKIENIETLGIKNVTHRLFVSFVFSLFF
jgi:hypothetical protein